MSKKTVARKFLEFAEEIQDPDFDTSTLEDDIEDDYSEPSVDVDDNEATISLPSEEGEGSAVTVVTPKGTSVSVTEKLAKAFLESKWFAPVCESLKSNLNEGAGGSNIFFSTIFLINFIK